MDAPIRPRILVVDPDPSLRVLLMAVLKRDGYDAEAADSLDEALRLGRTRRHAAILLEPRIRGGEELLDALHAVAHDGKPNVILVTAADGAGTPHAAGPGVRSVLLKPVRIDELAAVVADCCRS